MTANEVKQMLGLVPHPREGEWYVRTYDENGRVEELVAGWPAWEREIRELMRKEFVKEGKPLWTAKNEASV